MFVIITRLPIQAFMVECDECSDENKTALILTEKMLALAFLAFPVKFAVAVFALLKLYYIFTTTRAPKFSRILARLIIIYYIL